MTRNARPERPVPRIVAVSADGSRHDIVAERLELLFDDGRSLSLSFPDRAWGELEIEADAAAAGDTPVISLQAAACNALTLRVELLQGLVAVEADGTAVAGTAEEGAADERGADVVGGEAAGETAADATMAVPQAAAPGAAPAGGLAAGLAARPCTLTLTVQKALDATDRANAPKKNHIRRWAQAALETDAEVTVRLVGEAEGRELNRSFRGKDYATNVLSFAYNEGESLPLADDALLSGDLVLCVPVVVREAMEQGKTLEAHFAHLVVHGMLHLQAYNHIDADEAEHMEALERQILQRLGYPDPYA